MTLAACGTDVNVPSGPHLALPTSLPAGDHCVPGTISGAGSTFVQTLAQEWVAGYERACPRSTVDYEGVGSGAGIQQLTAGTVDFGASDVVMTPVELRAARASGGPVVQIPWAGGGVAIEYHLAGVAKLRLSPPSLAGIFAGTITRWDDPALRADNPGARLPSEGIQVFHRSDGSGTTAALTSYLAAAAPSIWKAGSGKEVAWPAGEGAKGSDQVTAAVEQSEGAIGYSEVSYALATGLAVAAIRNPAGHWARPTPAAVSAALEGSPIPADLEVEVNPLPTNPAAYPISTLTWALAFTTTTTTRGAPTANRAALLRSFLGYALGPGQAATRPLDYAPLPPDLLAADRAAAQRIGTAGG